MKVYQTYYNADSIEGRGPMVAGLTFLHREHAAEYIDDQPGVMGRRFKWSQEDYGYWMIKEIEVLDYSVIDKQKEQENLKQQALAKLSLLEREALGL